MKSTYAQVLLLLDWDRMRDLRQVLINDRQRSKSSIAPSFDPPEARSFVETPRVSDAFASAVARSAGQGPRSGADALALDAREHGGICSTQKNLAARTRAVRTSP